MIAAITEIRASDADTGALSPATWRGHATGIGTLLLSGGFAAAELVGLSYPPLLVMRSGRMVSRTRTWSRPPYHAYGRPV